MEEEKEEVKEEKNRVVRSQKYEEAARLRDSERQLSEKLAAAKKKWEEDTKTHRVTVTEDHVEEVVAMMTGIPVQRIAEKESGKLSRMEDDMADKVIGQPTAVRQVVRAIKRNRAGLKDPNKPVGSFIFLGPTGVGKTQLARNWPRTSSIPRKPSSASTCPSTWRSSPSADSSERLLDTLDTKKADSSPRRCAGSRSRSCCSTRSRRPIPMSSTRCCRFSKRVA